MQGPDKVDASAGKDQEYAEHRESVVSGALVGSHLSGSGTEGWMETEACGEEAEQRRAGAEWEGVSD